jgi:transmembrane sensor
MPDDRLDAETPTDGAARRLTRLISGRADALDHAELARWREADPRHEAAWQAVAAIWRDTARLRRDATGRILRQPAWRRPTWQRRAVVAVLTGAACGAGLFWDRGGPALLLGDITTGTAETLSRTLADGSRLTLDARSAVDFDPATRQLRLLSGALFVTVPAPLATGMSGLLATAGDATVTIAEAASLSISRRAGGVQVAVASGRAELHSRVGTSVAPLTAGRMIEVPPGRRPLPPWPVTIAGIGAWRHGRLVAEDRPLAELTEELGAHFRGLILLRGETAQKRVSVALDLDDVPAALASLADVLGGTLSWPVPRVALLRV